MIKFTPAGGGTVNVAAIRIVGGKVGGSTTNVWLEELRGAILGLLLEFSDTVQPTHIVVGEAHHSLEFRG